MDILGRLYLLNRKVFLSRHSVEQASRRGVPTRIVANTINTGKVRRYGKNNIRITKQYKKGNIECIGVISNNKIVIKTIIRSRR